MTNQDAFNIVWEHFVVKGNPPSRSELYGCAYRGENGERCAAGLLIPDEKYTPKMEGFTVYEGFVFDALPGGLDVRFIGALQNAHDDADPKTFREDVRESLEGVASRYGLEIPAEASA